MERIQNPLQNGYSFNFESYFKGGWNLVNKEFGVFVGMTLLIFGLTIIASLIPGLNIISNIFQYMFAGGYFIYMRNLTNNTQKAANFFDGFRFFVPILLYVIVLFLFFVPFLIIAFSIIFPFEIFWEFAMSGFQNQEVIAELGQYVLSQLPVFIITAMLFSIFSIYIYISYTFVIPLIVDAKMGFWDAMETSRKVVGKKFFSFLVWYIILGIGLSIGTIITCGLGLLILIPITYGILFEAYNQIFGENFNLETFK